MVFPPLQGGGGLIRDADTQWLKTQDIDGQRVRGGVVGPMRRYQRTGTQTIGTGSNTAVAWQAEDFVFDPDTFITHTSGTITLHRAGLVRFTGGLTWAANSNGNRIIVLWHNDVTNVAVTIPAASGNTHFMNVTTVVQVVAGDTLKVIAFQSSGGNLGVLSNPPTTAIVEYLRVFA